VEWVIVTYASTRDVFVDGRRTGATNQMFITREGTQTFDLGVPVDYRPPKRRVTVTDTVPADPMTIDFQSTA
jgi:hypothetical protein